MTKQTSPSPPDVYSITYKLANKPNKQKNRVYLVVAVATNLCKRSLFYKNAFNHKPCKQTPDIILTEIISAKCNFRVENISCLPVYD